MFNLRCQAHHTLWYVKDPRMMLDTTKIIYIADERKNSKQNTSLMEFRLSISSKQRQNPTDGSVDKIALFCHNKL